jgi:hypothetical protein
MNDAAAMEKTPTTDPWALWRANLAAKSRRERPAVDINRAVQGYYRIKRHGKWELIAYWYEDGELLCLMGKDFWMSEADAIEAFSYAWDNPISEETYNLVFEGGKWPDIDETVQAQIGDNRPPQDDFEQFKIDIENAAAAVERYKDIGDDEALVKARSAQARLTELAGQADKKRVEIKAKPLKECTDIDADWMPLIKLARYGASALGRYMGMWEDKKEAALEAQKEAGRREADRAIAQGVPPSAQQTPTPAEPLPPTRTQVKGGYGRAGHVHIRKIVNRTEPINWDALLQRYGADEDIRTLLIGKAERDLNNGHDVPGVTVTTERTVK